MTMGTAMVARMKVRRTGLVSFSDTEWTNYPVRFLLCVFSLFNNAPTHLVIDENKLEDAKTELRKRVQAALNGLLQCGIQGLPLDTQELIELYYDVYNPDTATRQQLKNFDDLTAPIVTKGEGRAAQPNLDRELEP